MAALHQPRLLAQSSVVERFASAFWSVAGDIVLVGLALAVGWPIYRAIANLL